MPKRDDPIGEIPCPLCVRPADVMKFGERNKLDPNGGEGKPAYARKLFIVCPPARGYTGCGTILCNSPNAQDRILDKATMYGAAGKPTASPAPIAAEPEKATPPNNPAPAPMPPPAKPQKKSAFDLW